MNFLRVSTSSLLTGLHFGTKAKFEASRSETQVNVTLTYYYTVIEIYIMQKYIQSSFKAVITRLINKIKTFSSNEINKI